MMKLNIGCGRNTIPGWVNLDMVTLPGVDCVFDLDNIPRYSRKLPFPDDTFDEMQMFHVIEHLSHPLPIMEELWRVAKPGCKLVIRCPYGSSDNAFEDPTHVRQYFLNSFMYFGQPAYLRADYSYRGDWQEDFRSLVLPKGVTKDMLPPSPQELMQHVMFGRNTVDEFHVQLSAVKPARQVTEVAAPVEVRFALQSQVITP
jgi:SAM-dependent methyltransferase